MKVKKQWNLITAIFFHATTATWPGSTANLISAACILEKGKGTGHQSGLHVWDGLITATGGWRIISGKPVCIEHS